jgi:hypothetical protein
VRFAAEAFVTIIVRVAVSFAARTAFAETELAVALVVAQTFRSTPVVAAHLRRRAGHFVIAIAGYRATRAADTLLATPTIRIVPALATGAVDTEGCPHVFDAGALTVAVVVAVRVLRAARGGEQAEEADEERSEKELLDAILRIHGHLAVLQFTMTVKGRVVPVGLATHVSLSVCHARHIEPKHENAEAQRPRGIATCIGGRQGNLSAASRFEVSMDSRAPLRVSWLCS